MKRLTTGFAVVAGTLTCLPAPTFWARPIGRPASPGPT
jgi:hypothetical protein